MANIKGIIVEIGGDTSALEKSLKRVNSSTISLNKELRGINSLLKLDPKNTELLSQKQTVLNKNIENTSEKLKSLKEAQQRYIESGGDLNTAEYRNLQREIINTENKLKNLQLENSKWTTAGKSIEEYGKKVSNLSSKINDVGTSLTTKLTLPIVGIATAGVKAFNEVDEGADTVIKKTGVVGETAKELEATYKKVSTSVVGDFNDIGSAVGEINTRFGFTGDALEEASEKFMKFAKVNDTDVNTSVQKVSRYMGDAGIEANKYGTILDQLTSVAQASGISIDNLTEMLTKYGAPMRALGLETEECIAIFAGWEKAGVNTEIAFSGMKKAIGTWGKQGKDSTEEFKKTLEEIKKCPDIASATTKAIEVFGQKAGPDLADAIKGGRFEYSQFLDIVKGSEGTLENTYAGVVDEADEAQIAIKELKVQFSEVGQEALKTVVPAFKTLLKGAGDLIAKYNKLSDSEKKQVNNMILFVASIGPAIKILGTLGKGIGGTITTIGNFSQAIGVVKNNTTSAIPAVNSLAKVFSMLSSPIGFTTIAIGGLCAAYAAYEIATQRQRASMDGLREKIEEERNSWNQLKETRKNTLDNSMTEIETTQKLADELKTIADENGRVKKGYEDRAQAILGILNQALGTEYKMTGNVIDKYKELTENIDNVIAKKKAEAVLSAYQEEYGKAIRDQTEATKNLVELKQRQIQAAQDMVSGTREEKIEASNLYTALTKQIQDQTNLVGEYGKTITDYENLQTASVQGTAQAVDEAITQMGVSYERGKQQQGESIEQQILNQGNYNQRLREFYQQALTDGDTYQAQVLQNQINAGNEQLNQLSNSLVQQTLKVQELSPEQIEAWRVLAQNSYTGYANALSQVGPDTAQEIQNATGIVAMDKGLQTQTGSLASRASSLYDSNMWVSDATKSEMDGANDAVSNSGLPQTFSAKASDSNADFSEYINYSKGKSATEDYFDGADGGILSKIGNFLRSLFGAGQKGNSEFRRGMGDGSPSVLAKQALIDYFSGADIGTEKGSKKTIKNIGNVGNKINKEFANSLDIPQIQNFGNLQSGIRTRIEDNTRTVFTTPQIVFNVQELDQAKLDQCFNYINRKFGSKY